MGAHATCGVSFRAKERAGPVLLAHRGSSLHEIENTLPAFCRALAEGADGVELDVRTCATGEVVVFHDDDLARLADRPERVAALPLAALREVRLRGRGEIPTLVEAIEACGAKALFNIEIKPAAAWPSACRSLVAGVAEVVGRMGVAERVLVSSFSPAALWLWRSLRSEVPCGLLCEHQKQARKEGQALMMLRF